MNIYQTKKGSKKYFNSNENMLFLRNTDKTIWRPPFLKDPPPPFFLIKLSISNHFFKLSISNHFFITPLFVQILKTRIPHTP